MAVLSAGQNRAGAQQLGASSRHIGITCQCDQSSTRVVPDELRSPIKHHLVLHRIDPEQGIRRFYSLMIERDLFGTAPTPGTGG
jgi:hypothetical protein